MEKRHIGYLLHRLVHVVDRDMNASFAACGLTHVQARVLLFIYHHGENGKTCGQKDLEQFLGIQKSSVTSVVNLMEKKGWMKRLPDPEDGRRNRLMLTEKALPYQAMAAECTEKEEQAISCHLSEKEVSELRAILSRLLVCMKGDGHHE